MAKGCEESRALAADCRECGKTVQAYADSKCAPVLSFKEALKYAESMDIRLIPYELAKGMQETKEILAAIEQGQSIGIFIGPEGGFEEKEVEAAISEGAKPITLGKRILRTETAGLAILSVLMFQLEN